MNMFDSKSNVRDIRDFSIKELEAELKRQREMAVPRPIQGAPITEDLIVVCKNYIELVHKRQPVHEAEHFIFEAAMEAVFGTDVWKWINSNL